GEDVLEVTGVVLHAADVRDEGRARQESGRRTRALRRVLEDAALAVEIPPPPPPAGGAGGNAGRLVAGRRTAGDRTVACAHVRRDDGDVHVGKAARLVLQRLHQHREVPAQVVLRQTHRRRVV